MVQHACLFCTLGDARNATACDVSCGILSETLQEREEDATVLSHELFGMLGEALMRSIAVFLYSIGGVAPFCVFWCQ